ncbi:DNTTIP2 family protein [Megaselia abdita]
MDLFVIDTLGSSDLVNSKGISKANSSYTIGDEKEIIRKPLEEPENEYDEEDFCGIPPPNKDISALISRTLSSSKTTTKKDKYSGYDNFAKSLGWDQDQEKKSAKSKNKKIEFPELNLVTGEVENNLSKTVIVKELEKTNLKGLEKNKQILNVSEKKLKEMRKVSFFPFVYSFEGLVWIKGRQDYFVIELGSYSMVLRFLYFKILIFLMQF